MPPPYYADLGKDARDFFNKGYHFNLIKLDIKCQTSSNVEFSFGGVKNIDTKNILGHLNTKYKFEEYGTTFWEKWNTDGVLGTEVTVEDWAEGLKASLDTAFQSGLQTEVSEQSQSFKRNIIDKIFRLKFHYKRGLVAANIEGELKSRMDPMIRGAIALGYDLQDISASVGASASLNVNQIQTPNHEIGVQVEVADFIATLTLANLNVFTGSVFHRSDWWLESGFIGSWSADGGQEELAAACKFKFDDDAALRVKVTRQVVIGLGYTQKLSEGVTIHLSAMLPGYSPKMFRESSVGLCLELTA